MNMKPVCMFCKTTKTKVFFEYLIMTVKHKYIYVFMYMYIFMNLYIHTYVFDI